MIPESRKRSESDAIGGAYSTMIRAEVKADDHIRANRSPIPIARIFKSVSACLPGVS